MYARSYEANEPLASAVALPSDYHGVAFEKEEERALPTEEECTPAVAEATEEKSVLASFFGRIWPKGRMHREGSLFSSLLSDTEDILLLGIFLLLLLSKEGDPLCAAAVLILFISDKI